MLVIARANVRQSQDEAMSSSFQSTDNRSTHRTNKRVTVVLDSSSSESETTLIRSQPSHAKRPKLEYSTQELHLSKEMAEKEAMILKVGSSELIKYLLFAN